MIIALAALASSAVCTPSLHAQSKPFLPVCNPEIKAMIYRQLPDPGADQLRLCVKDRVCTYRHQNRSMGVTITIPLGGKRGK